MDRQRPHPSPGPPDRQHASRQLQGLAGTGSSSCPHQRDRGRALHWFNDSSGPARGAGPGPGRGRQPARDRRDPAGHPAEPDRRAVPRRRPPAPPTRRTRAPTARPRDGTDHPTPTIAGAQPPPSGRSRRREGESVMSHVWAPWSSSPTRPCCSRSTTRGRRVPDGHRAVRRAGALARAHPHLPADPARAVERPRRRARRRAGRGHPAHLLPLPGAALAAGRRRRDDGPLRPAAAATKHPPTGWCWAAPTGRCWSRCCAAKKVKPLVGARLDDDTVVVHPSERGHLKQVLLKLGWPAEDLAGYVDGEAHPIELRRTAGSCGPTSGGGRSTSGTAARRGGAALRGRQDPGRGRPRWPRPQATTLILVTNTVVGPAVARRAAAPDHADRGRDRRVLRCPQGDPPGHHRDVPGDDHATEGVYPHLELFDARDWGLIIYDEVHLLPAPMFRMTADLQARRRLGLTATLVREDGGRGTCSA